MADLIAIFLVAFVGSVHCVGMCGGFVLALAQVHAGAPGVHRHHLLYFAGKTLTYSLLGAAVGGVGHAVGGAWAGMQDVLSLVLGVFLVGVALGLLGLGRRFDGPRALTAWLARLTTALGQLLRRRTPTASFGLGLVNGLLPCGLVYAGLAMAAASGSVRQGALLMAVFGAATIPALYALAWLGGRLRPAWRVRLNRLGGVLVLLLGLLTIARGTPVLEAALHHLHGGAAATHEEGVPPAPGPHTH